MLFNILSQQSFSVILGFLVFCSWTSLGIQIMVDRLSSVICYSQLWLFKTLSQQSFSVILGFLVFCSCFSLGIQIMVDRLSSVICYSQLWLFKTLSQQSFSVILGFLVFYSCSNNGGQTFIGDFLELITKELLHSFRFLVFYCCSALSIQIMTIRPSGEICCRWLWIFSNLSQQNFLHYFLILSFLPLVCSGHQIICAWQTL